MEETRPGLRSKREVAPKITNTKITISKSTPFLISKHHLDDTQMYRLPEQGEAHQIMMTKQSRITINELTATRENKIKQKFETFQSPSNPIERPYEMEKREQYYPEMKNKHVQVQSNVFKPRVNSNHHSQLKSNADKNTEVNCRKKSVAHNANDYGMQEKIFKQASKKLQKQAEKLRKIHKKNVQYDLKVASNNKIVDLQEQIKQLKIKSLQLQKQRWINELLKSNQLISQPQNHQKNGQFEKKEATMNPYSILRKPRFKIKHEQNEDTDSSFSSFQLQ